VDQADEVTGVQRPISGLIMNLGSDLHHATGKASRHGLKERRR
jgi:hypothetical protein